MSDGILPIPIWLGDNLPCFEYSRKIALTTSLRKARRGRDSSPLSQLIQYNTPRTLQNNIYHSNKRVPPSLFNSDTNPVFGHVLIHSFEYSGCNSGINFVVTLEYTFFQLCSNSEKISVRLTRFSRSHVKRPAVVLTSHTSDTSFLLDVRCAAEQRYLLIPISQIKQPVFLSLYLDMVCNELTRNQILYSS